MNKENSSLFTNCMLSEKMKTDLCKKHQKPMGNSFCVNCLSYLLCSSCIYQEHAGHQVLGFGSVEQNKQQTKSILLQTLQQTLKSLKRRENQVKNWVAQIQLISNSLKTLQNQVMKQLTTLFKNIQSHIQNIINKEQNKLQNQLQQFYKKYHSINDQLSDNLMQILNGDINIMDFNRSVVIKQPPLCPDFSSFKSIVQKNKKKFRSILENLQTIQKNLMGSKQSTQQISKTSKLQKYLDRCKVSDKVNQSFLKTMNLIGKQNIQVLNLCRKVKK